MWHCAREDMNENSPKCSLIHRNASRIAVGLPHDPAVDTGKKEL